MAPCGHSWFYLQTLAWAKPMTKVITTTHFSEKPRPHTITLGELKQQGGFIVIRSHLYSLIQEIDGSFSLVNAETSVVWSTGKYHTSTVGITDCDWYIPSKVEITYTITK